MADAERDDMNFNPIYPNDTKSQEKYQTLPLILIEVRIYHLDVNANDSL